jgi:hypothetical protein
VPQEVRNFKGVAQWLECATSRDEIPTKESLHGKMNNSRGIKIKLEKRPPWEKDVQLLSSRVQLSTMLKKCIKIT